MTNEQIDLLQELNYPLYQLLQENEAVNSDDEPDAGENSPQQQPSQASHDTPSPAPAEPEEPSEEDVFNMELSGTQDKFLQFVLYDKLNELSNKIEIIKDSIQIKDTTYDLKFTGKLDQYAQYIEVLNELIFSISVNTVYNIVGQVELELIALLEDYVKFHEGDKE